MTGAVGDVGRGVKSFPRRVVITSDLSASGARRVTATLKIAIMSLAGTSSHYYNINRRLNCLRDGNRCLLLLSKSVRLRRNFVHRNVSFLSARPGCTNITNTMRVSSISDCRFGSQGRHLRRVCPLKSYSRLNNNNLCHGDTVSSVNCLAGHGLRTCRRSRLNVHLNLTNCGLRQLSMPCFSRASCAVSSLRLVGRH